MLNEIESPDRGSPITVPDSNHAGRQDMREDYRTGPGAGWPSNTKWQPEADSPLVLSERNSHLANDRQFRGQSQNGLTTVRFAVKSHGKTHPNR